MNSYPNSKTKYSKTRIITAITIIIYSIIALLILGFLFYLLIDPFLKSINNSTGLVVVISIALLILLALIVLLSITTVVYIISIINNIKIIKYYKNNPLTDIKEMMIPYDYKLWLTAPKNSFHPISIIYNEKTYKTAIIFTNSQKYNTFPKFKMPDTLQAKNYVKNYAIIGYDEKKDEIIIINYKK